MQSLRSTSSRRIAISGGLGFRGVDMAKIDKKAIWPWLNENLALPMSLAALAFTGLSYFSDQQRANEERTITQGVVWRSSKSSEVEGMLSLTQPNDAVAVQRVHLNFPHSLRADPISLPPSQLEVRGTWIEGAMQALWENCRKIGTVQLIEGQIPVQVATYYSVAGKSRVANDFYTLAYMATLHESGMVDLELESLAIAGTEDIKSAINSMNFDWHEPTCELGPRVAERTTPVKAN